MAGSQLELLKLRIPYDDKIFSSDEIYSEKLNMLLEDSKNIALSELYPYEENFDGIELPSKYYNWQLRASVELYKWEGNQGVKTYSESNLSWSRANDGVLSNTLMNELVPKAGIPKRKVIEQ